MKTALLFFVSSLFVTPAFAGDSACLGTKNTPNTAKFYFDPVGKDVDRGNEGEQLPYRIKLTYNEKILLDKVVMAYLFEDVIYFDGDQKEEAWVDGMKPENSGLIVPAKNLNLRFDCVPAIGRPFQVTE